MNRRLFARVALYGLAGFAAYVVVRHPGAVLRLFQGRGTRSVSSVVAEHGARVESKFRPVLGAWPPSYVELLAFKSERVVELWAGASRDRMTRLATYPIRAASGALGPKRIEGDLQVPEGVYALPTLNPNSNFHLSILVDYPNDDDVARSTVPRDRMGGEIYVHGKSASIGCIAIGDEAIEEVFTTAALVPASHREIIIAPVDLRAPTTIELPRVDGLYEKLRAALAPFR